MEANKAHIMSQRPGTSRQIFRECQFWEVKVVRETAYHVGAESKYSDGFLRGVIAALSARYTLVEWYKYLLPSSPIQLKK